MSRIFFIIFEYKILTMRFLTLFLYLISLPISAETDFEKAEQLYKQEKFEQAKALFESVLKNNPTDYKAIEYLGDIASHQNNWDEAIGQYKNLKTLFPKTANYQYKFGGALAMKAKTVSMFTAYGMIAEIETTFLTAAKLDPKHIDSRWALIIFYIELPGIVGGSEKKAQKYSNELMVLSKVDGFLAKAYIDCYFNRLEKAEASYVKAHEIGNSKTTFQMLYEFYLNKLRDKAKANKLKESFSKNT